MNYTGNRETIVPAMGIGNQTVHPWIQARLVQQPGEQLEQGMHQSPIPSYITQFNHPSVSYIQIRLINHNYESITVQEQIRSAGVTHWSCQITIPIELLDVRSILQALPRVGLKEIVFLGPHPSWSDFFLQSSHDFTMRATNVLSNVRSLKKITFSLDLSPIGGILQALAAIPDLEEIVVTSPTASRFEPDSPQMLEIQQTFVDWLYSVVHLKRFTIPMDFITGFLLSHLAQLPSLESLTVNYSPPQHSSPQQNPFPSWSSYQTPAERPGYIFLSHLNFDPRGPGRFQRLEHLDLGVPSTDSSYASLKRLFPGVHVC